MKTYPACAKINLALHITGQRADGYHELDSIVVFAQHGDALSVSPSEEMTLSIIGPFSGGLEGDENNLVLRAAHALKRFAPQDKSVTEATIVLQKNLPVASGIGGGSADAAASLLALNDLWALGLSGAQLRDIGLSLGADVPMCIAGVPCRVSGIGEQIEQLSIPPLPIVLVNPRVGVSTPQVFSHLKTKDNSRLSQPQSSQKLSDWIDYLARQRNDLQAPAQELAPDISRCLAALEAASTCVLARMSGSGATCFGLYETQEAAKTAAHLLTTAQPHWWVQESVTQTQSTTPKETAA